MNGNNIDQRTKWTVAQRDDKRKAKKQRIQDAFSIPEPVVSDQNEDEAICVEED